MAPRGPQTCFLARIAWCRHLTCIWGIKRELRNEATMVAHRRLLGDVTSKCATSSFQAALHRCLFETLPQNPRPIKNMPPVPLRTKLYEAVKRQADATFESPSAYKSGWIVKTYKRLGGKYADDGARAGDSGLGKWFREAWVDLNRLRTDGSFERCGRQRAVQGGRYPLCRPSIRVDRTTPKTVKELSPRAIQTARKRKSRSPGRHVRF